MVCDESRARVGGSSQRGSVFFLIGRRRWRRRNRKCRRRRLSKARHERVERISQIRSKGVYNCVARGLK